MAWQIPPRNGSFRPIILSLIEILSYPIITLQRATGIMRDYQIVSGTIHLLNFPIAWLFLIKGSPAYCVYCVAIFLAIINTFARLYMLHRIIPISMSTYCQNVLSRVLLVSVISYISISILTFSHIINVLMSVILCVISCVLGLDKTERKMLVEFIKSKV